MFKSKIVDSLGETIRILGYPPVQIVLSIPENEQFGEYSTNVALQLSKLEAKKSYQSPREIANDILDNFGHPDYLERIEVAGPGFINFYLKNESLIKVLDEKEEKRVKLRRVLLEYASPNAFKPFHIGHLRNLVTGEAVARLLQFEGSEIFKATYNSDIGLSAAKALWGVVQLEPEFQKMESKDLKDKAEFLGRAYVLGSSKYDEDPQSKTEIDQVNVKLYQKDPQITEIWLKTRGWSQGYLNSIFSRLGTEFDAEVWESEVEEEGKRIVTENIGKVFTQDQGAVIFPGEKYGLHTRVFINSAGNPTYEAKEVGNAFREMELFPFDEVIHVVGNEQIGYFQVVIKAIELIEKRLEGKKKHLAYGFVNLTTGKMSSRKGNVVQADDLIDQVKDEIRQQFLKGELPSDEKIVEQIAVGAIKFFLLKYSISSDISFDIKQSVSLQGDSGPYVQYAYVRTQSVLGKSQKAKESEIQIDLTEEEKQVLKQLEYKVIVIDQVIKNLEPNKLAEYLLELAKSFNYFYQRCPIINSERESLRLKITEKVGETLKQGLYLLGIEAPERM